MPPEQYAEAESQGVRAIMEEMRVAIQTGQWALVLGMWNKLNLRERGPVLAVLKRICLPRELRAGFDQISSSFDIDAEVTANLSAGMLGDQCTIFNADYLFAKLLQDGGLISEHEYWQLISTLDASSKLPPGLVQGEYSREEAVAAARSQFIQHPFVQEVVRVETGGYTTDLEQWGTPYLQVLREGINLMTNSEDPAHDIAHALEVLNYIWQHQEAIEGELGHALDLQKLIMPAVWHDVGKAMSGASTDGSTDSIWAFFKDGLMSRQPFYEACIRNSLVSEEVVHIVEAKYLYGHGPIPTLQELQSDPDLLALELDEAEFNNLYLFISHIRGILRHSILTIRGYDGVAADMGFSRGRAIGPIEPMNQVLSSVDLLFNYSPRRSMLAMREIMKKVQDYHLLNAEYQTAEREVLRKEVQQMMFVLLAFNYFYHQQADASIYHLQTVRNEFHQARELLMYLASKVLKAFSIHVDMPSAESALQPSQQHDVDGAFNPPAFNIAPDYGNAAD